MFKPKNHCGRRDGEDGQRRRYRAAFFTAVFEAAATNN